MAPAAMVTMPSLFSFWEPDLFLVSETLTFPGLLTLLDKPVGTTRSLPLAAGVGWEIWQLRGGRPSALRPFGFQRGDAPSSSSPTCLIPVPVLLVGPIWLQTMRVIRPGPWMPILSLCWIGKEDLSP